MKIAILITTFLRDNLLKETIINIKQYKPDNSIILIGDQNPTEEKQLQYTEPDIFYYGLPFDCGLSYSRNYLVQKAQELECYYCLMLADSINFLTKYNFSPIIKFLSLEENRGLVGFNLENSICPWEYLMEVTPQGIKFSYSDQNYCFDNLKLIKIDICRNIFLAKTSTLLHLWDDELKLGEHELAFLEYKKRGYEAFWTDSYLFKKIIDKNNEQYTMYRKRLNNYLKLVQKKLGITGWVIYPPKRRI